MLNKKYELTEETKVVLGRKLHRIRALRKFGNVNVGYVAEYIQMINGFTADNIGDTAGPYKLGRLDKFEIYVEPSYDPSKWVMCCKSNNIHITLI